MRHINCDEVLNRSDFLNLNDNDFEEQTKRYCINKLREYEEKVQDNLDSFKDYPEKKYELFYLDMKKNNLIFLLEKNLIHYNDDIQNQELFYSSVYAVKYCDNIKRLNEDAVMQDEYLKAEYQDEIERLIDINTELKELDENEFNNDRFIYNSFSESKILYDIIDISKENDAKTFENEKLKEKIKKQEEIINDLTNKLKISLDDIESTRKKLKLNNKSKFEKLLDKIKEIMN